MEEVEKANIAAVESCHRVISMLNQPQDQNLCRQTGEAVQKFKKVVSLLNSSCGHARVRKSKKIQAPYPQNIFLENPILRNDDHHRHHLQQLQQPKPLQLLQINPVDKEIVKNSLTLGSPSLELSSHGKNLRLAQQTPPPNHSFLQQQRLHFQLQQQQQMKQQAELMYRRSNSGISLNFDSSSCTPTMSSTRSFISSLSMDGSVANLDGSAFRLIGAARSADQASLHQKRRCSGRGEDGSVKCGGTGRCHCSKKRCLFKFLLDFC